MPIEPAPLPEDFRPIPDVALKPSRRLEAVDALRGLVMVLMVLDHTRDYFGDASLNPTADPTRSGSALFFTRWVTHFCAPTFAFLAGVGAYLAGSKYRSRSELAAYLATRGLWLIFLELTVERFGLLFNPYSRFLLLVVLWSIGGSFLVLAALVFLPGRLIGALGVLLIATHGIASAGLERLGLPTGLNEAAGFLLRPTFAQLPGGVNLLSGYPLLPWLGVVAAGYGFGEVLRLEHERRWRTLVITGLVLTTAFLVLRAWGRYGDPTAWSVQDTPMMTVLAFLNCTKQPPSPLFILMTLGPAIAAMGLIDRAGIRGPIGRALVTLGRVPLFYYLLQWYVIHGLAILAGLARGLQVSWLFGPNLLDGAPEGWPLSLPGVYLAWLAALAVLYFPCRWFAGLKARHPGGWLSYL